ncbi:MAG: hypothetical protein ACLFQW_04615 [Spirochaetaceae bacterium]
MVNIVCDACKKTIQGADKETNVIFITDKNLCIPCNDKLEETVREEMKKERVFTLEKYNNKRLNNLNKMCK